jgi:FkbM family methyltransferase
MAPKFLKRLSEMTMLKSLCLRSLQNIIILIVRPYVVRELFGWGKLYALIGDYRRDWLWMGAPIKAIRGKVHGYIMHLDLSKWSSRSTYFLGRWNNLEMQLFMSDLLRPADTVVDVGANNGMFSLVASSLLGDSGKVICFEPNPSCLRVLDQQIVSNQIRNILVHGVGLGEEEGELTLSIPFFNSGEGTFGASIYSERETYKVKANIIKGDDLLLDQNPTLIKIDVEGFECSVLAGLGKTIRRHHPIIVTEIVPRQLAACGFSIRDLVELMRRDGYEGYKLRLRKVHGYYTWEAGRLKMEDRDYDAVWIHPASSRDRVEIVYTHLARI